MNSTIKDIDSKLLHKEPNNISELKKLAANFSDKDILDEDKIFVKKTLIDFY